MTDKLKPCPFCEGDKIKLYAWNPDGGGVCGAAVCERCGASQTANGKNEGDALEKARNKWNTRPIAESLRAQLAEQSNRIESLDAERLDLIALGAGRDKEIEGLKLGHDWTLAEYTNKGLMQAKEIEELKQALTLIKGSKE
jgi:hypothetical protein